MSVDETRKLDVLRQWVQKAEHDLLAATQLLKLGRQAPTEIVCFHAQQCVEKYLKALLVFHEVEPPRTHNIPRLLELMPVLSRPDVTRSDQVRLTDYATVSRYPGQDDPLSVAQARAAVRLVRRIRTHVRKRLPKAVLK